jgi:putative ABC transport system ATP-binding protein
MSDERHTRQDDEQWRPPGRHAADPEPVTADPGAVAEPAPGRHAAADPAAEPVGAADPEVRASDVAREDEVRPAGRHATAEPEPVGAVLIEAFDVRKTYRRGPEEVHALDGVSFELRTGEVVGLVGPSGSGKTTLLNLLCGWEHADSGDVRWPSSGDTPAERRPWIDLAILPQSLGLVEELSVRENIELPIRLKRERANGKSNGKEASKAEKEAHAARIDDLMDALGLIKFADRGPFEISLGEQQRTALARALVLRPKLLLADEPTGHQDAQWGRGVFGVIREAAALGTCCFIATHNQEAVKFVDRMIAIQDGHLADVDVEAARAAVD